MIKTAAGVTIGTAPPLRKFLRLAQVREVTGLPPSSIYALMAEGKFPRPFSLSQHRVAWLEDDVAQWQAEKLAARENVAA